MNFLKKISIANVNEAEYDQMHPDEQANYEKSRRTLKLQKKEAQEKRKRELIDFAQGLRLKEQQDRAEEETKSIINKKKDSSKFTIGKIILSQFEQ